MSCASLNASIWRRSPLCYKRERGWGLTKDGAKERRKSAPRLILIEIGTAMDASWKIPGGEDPV